MKQKTILFSLFLLCILFKGYSQEIYLPAKIVKDTVQLKKYMPTLAKAVLQHLAKTPKKDRDAEYFGCKFAIETLATLYDNSLQSIDSLRLMGVKEGVFASNDSFGYLNIYETYNNIKITQREGDNRSDVALFSWGFPIVISELKGNAYQFAIEPYQQNVTTLEAEWQEELANMRSNQKDSVSTDDAIMFCQAYLQKVVYIPLVPIGKKLLHLMDNKNFIIQDSVMLTMRDGVKVAAVIVRDRKITQPLPIVMMANIYAGPTEVQSAKDIANHGYVGVILNPRGKYVSGVTIEPWEHDAQDIYDAIDWLCRQPWCNGKVGMYGGSYLGFTQWAATKKMHPALQTIVPQVAAAPGIDFPMHNSIFSSYMLRWLHNVTNNQLTDWAEFTNTDYWNTAFSKWYKSGKPFNQLDNIEGRPNAIFQRWLQHPSYDKYWQDMIPYQQEFSKINIPVLSITGYFDGDQLGALYYLKEHYRWNTKANHYLLIGPYDHGGAQGSPTPLVNGYAIDEVAKVDITKLVFEWFDYTLKGKTKPTLLKDKINVQVMDANTWIHVPTFQQLNNDTLYFYLSAIKKGQFYQLATKKSLVSIQQKEDFTIRKEVKSSETYKLLNDSLNTDGGIVFVSDVLKEDLSINGSFKATLAATINKKDMDIAVALYQQRPDGKYFLLSSTIHRASYAKDKRKRNLLQPNVQEFIPVTGSFISKKIEKGSKLVILIGVLNSKHIEINYGTGKVVASESIAVANKPLVIQWGGNSNFQIPVHK